MSGLGSGIGHISVNSEFADYTQTWYRWVILVTYTMVLTGSSFTMMSFSPISTIVSEVYEVDSQAVNSCVVVFLVSFIFFNFISVFALETFGLATTVST
jgi:hypothetical protein